VRGRSTANADFDANSTTDSEPNSDAYTYAESDPYGYADPNSDTDGHANPNSDTDAGRSLHADADDHGDSSRRRCPVRKHHGRSGIDHSRSGQFRKRAAGLLLG
jgi:hypothetical protein